MALLDQSIIHKFSDTIRSVGLTGFLGVWGGVLSTCLASIKFLEFRRERLRLSTTYSFSDAEHGNEIVIQNPSKMPVIISHWELMWRKRRLFRSVVTEDIDYGFPEDRREIIIAAHDTHALVFGEEDHFSWGYKTVKKGKLYIRLHIAGRAKPIVLEVYDPRS
jgi:hypothetical protein